MIFTTTKKTSSLGLRDCSLSWPLPHLHINVHSCPAEACDLSPVVLTTQTIKHAADQPAAAALVLVSAVFYTPLMSSCSSCRSVSSVGGSVSRLVSRSVGGLVTYSVGRSFRWSVSRSVVQLSGRSVEQSFSLSVVRSVGQSVSQSVAHSPFPTCAPQVSRAPSPSPARPTPQRW